MKKEKSNWGLIFIVCLIIIFLGILIFAFCEYLDISKDKFTKEEKEEEITDYRILDGIESLSIGRELYEEATKIYTVWNLYPYCGYDIPEIEKKEKFELGALNIGNGSYYQSDFQNIESLKEYLKKWLSEEIIEEKINQEPVTDIELLKESRYAFTDYVIKDDKLYCRSQPEKEITSKYLNNYTITVSNIKKNTITYNIKSSYAKEEANSKCLESLNIKNCTKEDIEYKDTIFIIKKNKTNNWIVSSYTMHE